MQHISTTPFGRRPITADLMAAQGKALAPDPGTTLANKWQILRELGAARRHFGLGDRTLTLLSALISFHPGDEIDGRQAAIVFPSNRTLAARAHGMAESTMRRHLTNLVAAGLILRHDSPNGKRYARRGTAQDHAFGFDLSPLARRQTEIFHAAAAIRTRQETERNLREVISLSLRDCHKLLDHLRSLKPDTCPDPGDQITAASRMLRRKLDLETLEELATQTGDILAQIRAHLPIASEETSGNDSQNERHIQDSKQNNLESEMCQEEGNVKPVATPAQLSLKQVMEACPDLADYAPDGIRDWADLHRTAGHIRPMTGIDRQVWEEAQRLMSPAMAAVTLACILQSFDRITRPGAYLRSLARKAAQGRFSPEPMVRALLNRQNQPTRHVDGCQLSIHVPG